MKWPFQECHLDLINIHEVSCVSWCHCVSGQICVTGAHGAAGVCVKTPAAADTVSESADLWPLTPDHTARTYRRSLRAATRASVLVHTYTPNLFIFIIIIVTQYKMYRYIQKYMCAICIYLFFENIYIIYIYKNK